MTTSTEETENTIPQPAADGEPLEQVEVAPEVEEKPKGPDAQAQITRLKEQLLRTAADFDNFRKRARRDVEEASRRSKEQAVSELLPLVDNLERAVESAGGATDVEAVTSGIKMVLRSFSDIAGRLGLERVDAVGQVFDPNLHDAVQQVETDEHPPGTIVTEITPGYRLGDKLLRAALVVVSRPPSGN
ncbi:MAG: nucleotide exchange factor GrpE [Polyangiales bacterium]